MKVLIVIGVMIVAAILLAGVTVMFRGGEVNRKYSNKLMQLRVAAQAAVIVIIIIMAWAAGNGPG